MKGIIMASAFIVVTNAVAFTQTETNQVLMAMGLRIMCDGGFPCDTPALKGSRTAEVEPDDEPVFTLTSFDALFEDFPTNSLVGSLTVQERRAIFDADLWNYADLPSNKTSEVRYRGSRCSQQLRFCVEHNQTNYLPVAERILLSPHARHVVDARYMFEAFAKPSEETYRFMECVLTNRPDGLMTFDQVYLFSSFGKILRRNKAVTDPSIISNGVRLAHRFIAGQGRDGANTFDVLMREIVPDYEMSSNRLAFAIETMAAPKRHDIYDAQRFFSRITNALLNASEPLKVLDLSWLDEPMTSGNSGNGNEQQEENND